MKKLTFLLLMLTAWLSPSVVFAQSSNEFDLDEERPLITDLSQLSSPWSEPELDEGYLEYLLDGDPDTYWHTNWHRNVEPHVHYLQIELNEPVHELIAMKFARRWHNYRRTDVQTSDHVTLWSICGSDDPDADESKWVELALLSTPYHEPGEVVVTDAFDTKGKQYLRLYADATNTNRGYWHMAEVQLYPIIMVDDVEAAVRAALNLFAEHVNELYEFQEHVGSAPGQYSPEAVAAFAAAMDAVSALDGAVVTLTLEEVNALAENLEATYQAAKESLVPFTLADGYYRLRHSLIFRNSVPTGELDENGNPMYETVEVPKYMYSTVSGEKIYARWHTPDFNEVTENCPTLWKVTNKDGLFDIVNCATDARFDLWVSTSLTMSAESENLIAVDLIRNVDGVPQVALRVSTQGTNSYFHPLHHGINVGASFGTGTEDVIMGWANDASHVSEWVFEQVNDDEALAIIKEYEPFKDQAQLVEKYKLMLADAQEKLEIAKDLGVECFEDKPLINSVEQLSSPWSCNHEWEGDLSHLVDGDVETYWHSNWSDNSHRHYLQVALNEPVHELIAFWFVRRWHNYNSTVECTGNHVTKWSFWGSDDPEADDADWVMLGESVTPYTHPGEVLTSNVFDTQGKQYLRVYAEENNSNNRCMHLAEVQLYPSRIIDPANSQYHGMGAIGQALDNALNQLKDVDPEAVTVEQFTLLKQAYEPFIAKFVDPTVLREKIESVKGADEIIEIGNNPGFWKDSRASDALAKAIADAQAYDAAGKYSPEQSEAQMAALDAAVAGIKTSAIQVQPGKWYRIRFGTEEEYAEHNWNTGGNETDYRTVDGEPTDIVINEANFGHYMTVARLVRVTDEDEGGSYTQNIIEPVDESDVAIGDQLYGDALEDIEDPDMALFRFISLGDSAYIVQNKATGLYLQKKAEDNNGIYLSLQPSFFSQEIVGYGQSAFFIKTLSNEAQNPLHFARNKNVVITYGYYGDSDGRRGCFYIEEAEDVAADYAPNTTRMKVWEGAMNACCYPVAMTATDEDQGKMWTVTALQREAATGDTPITVKVTLKQLEGNTAPAGVPFIYVESGEYIPEEERTENDEPQLVDFTFGSEFVAEPQNSGILKGAFSPVTVGAGVLEITETQFVRTGTASASIKTDGAYITDGEEVPRSHEIELLFEEIPEDGIAENLAKVSRTADIYTIDGRLFRKGGNINALTNAHPGIYIVNGVKVVVK